MAYASGHADGTNETLDAVEEFLNDTLGSKHAKETPGYADAVAYLLTEVKRLRP